MLAGIFASVFSPTELFYARAEAQEISTSAPVTVVESLPQMADRISLELAPEEPTSTLRNLVWSESRWDPDASNKGGDRGLVQINKWAHPEVNDAEAYDPDFALRFASRAIADHTEAEWVVCNCWLYLKTRVAGLPRMAEIIPNGTPRIGAVAIFVYKDKRTGRNVRHVALIEKLSDSGFTVAETNFTKCLFDRRWIAWGDPHLVGFWSQ